MKANPNIPRCGSCRGYVAKADRARFPRLCQACRRQIHEDWKRDYAAIVNPAWPATTAAGIRAGRTVAR